MKSQFSQQKSNVNKIMRLVSIMASLIFGANAFAHGEDKPGPHGGSIRMPGAFHTEVVVRKPDQIEVYLLDLQWANPSVKDSAVAITHTGNRRAKAKCEKKLESYLCTFAPEVDFKLAGKILVEATREGQRGSMVEYQTPLPPSSR